MIIRAGRVSAALIVAGTFIWGHGSGYAQTSTWKIDPAHSSVNFEISHMAVSHVHGSLTNVNGIVELNDKDITKSSVEATIDTTTVSTGVVMRDNTLKSEDFFNVQKYPQITFRSSSLRRNKGTVPAWEFDAQRGHEVSNPRPRWTITPADNERQDNQWVFCNGLDPPKRLYLRIFKVQHSYRRRCKVHN